MKFLAADRRVVFYGPRVTEDNWFDHDGPYEIEDEIDDEKYPRDYWGRFAVRDPKTHLTVDRRELDPNLLRWEAKKVAYFAELAGHPTAREGLWAVQRLRAHVERLEFFAVANARGFGWSWAEVADALGLSKQTVHRRYGVADPTPRKRPRNKRWR